LSSESMLRAYNDNVLVGERLWSGAYTDVPAMGSDGSLETAGYCDLGDNLKLTITLDDGQEYILSGDIPAWSNNEIYTIENLEISNNQPAIPSEIVIVGAFPNPFNPSTVISYEIHESSSLSVSVYNINGQLVSTLHNGYQEAGRYELIFDGSSLSSGMYFVKIDNQSSVQTQKILLMK